MSTLKKAPNDVDRLVGSRVRMRRLLIGMSQEKLGEALGITFQQVQKYEKGVNRISASRLRQIADTLGVTIDFFYEGTEPGGAAGASQPGFAESGQAGYEPDLMWPEGLKLLKSFRAIRDPQVRRRVLDLVQALAGPGGGEEGRRSE